MNKAIRFFTFLGLLAFLTNCATRETEQSQTDSTSNFVQLSANQLVEFNIENAAHAEEIKLSELGITDIEYIPLETNEKSLISNIRKFCVGNNEFVIYPARGNIMKFTTDGEFVTTVGNAGRGPNEYDIVHDIKVEPTTGNVYVLTGWEDQFYVFSPEGDFVKHIPAPVNATSFYFNNDEILYYCQNINGNVDDNIIITSLNGDSITAFANKYKYERGSLGLGFVNEHFLFKLNDEVLLKEIHGDTVFSFDGDVFTPKFVVNRGNKRLLPEARTINNREQMNTNMASPMFAYTFFITKDFMYYFGSDQMETTYIVGTLENGQINVRSSVGKLVNDIDGGPKIALEKPLDETTILTWINPVELKSYLSSDDFQNSTPLYPEKKQELQELANSLDENDNPVLMLVKLEE